MPKHRGPAFLISPANSESPGTACMNHADRSHRPGEYRSARWKRFSSITFASQTVDSPTIERTITDWESSLNSLYADSTGTGMAVRAISLTVRQRAVRATGSEGSKRSRDTRTKSPRGSER